MLKYFKDFYSLFGPELISYTLLTLKLHLFNSNSYVPIMCKNNNNNNFFKTQCFRKIKILIKILEFKISQNMADVTTDPALPYETAWLCSGINLSVPH